MKNIQLEILLLVFISTIKIFSQEVKMVFPVAVDSSYSEINPYLTKYWYSGMNNDYYVLTTINNYNIKPIWFTFVETDFKNFSRIAAYNLPININKPLNKFIISDTLKKTINRNPKIENFLGKPVAVWEGKDSSQTDLYFSIFSDSAWSEPKKVTNDTLTETSFVFYTHDAGDLENQTNLNNILFWKTNNSIMFTSLSPEFIWNSVKSLYASNFEINNLTFRTSYSNDSYLVFTENSADSSYIKFFIQYRDSTNWIGPITVISSDTLISQVETNINYDGFITLTYVKGNYLSGVSFNYRDSLEFKTYYGNDKLEISDNIKFVSNTLSTGGCVIAPTPYFLIATKTDTSTELILSMSEFLMQPGYNLLDYHTKRETVELSLSGLLDYNDYFVSWSEFDGKQYDIYLYSDYIPFGAVNDKEIKENIFLSQNYPNPFNPTTTIEYTVPSPFVMLNSFQHLDKETPEQVRGDKVDIRLIIYDVLGKEITTLVNERQKPGTYQATFDASNLSSGVYYYQLIIGNFVETKKMILLR